MAIGVNWAEIWDPVWKAVWAQGASVVVPDVVGQDQASATTELEGDGFVVEVRVAFSQSVQSGSVISQSPIAGTSAQSGSTVVITISRGGRTAAGKRRNYIIGDKRYFNITNEELAYLIARDLIDVGRDEIKVTYKNKKPHKIPKDAWTSLEATLARLDSIKDPPKDEDDDFILL